MKAVVFTLGCKVNEVESAAIMATLEKLGWETDDRLSPADIYVLNTCAVTREAERKSRQLISRVRRFSPSAPIYVVGCASQKDAGQFLRKGVNFVGGTLDKQEVVKAVARDFNQSCADTFEYPKQVRTRAFIKIEDGCNNFCSYCVIPYLRGRVQSRSVQDIIGEIARCTAPEIVLTGINISAYSSDGEGLAGLVGKLDFTPARIRLGSVECSVIDEELLSALGRLQDFAPQFHLSLQSGSDRVLKAMNRKYTRAQYLEKCKLIYSAFPDAAITTDIIAGFPAEEEVDFEGSLSIIDEAGFARVHAFAFSPREGTVAYKMRDLPAEVKADRLHRLLNKGEEAERRYITARLGRSYQVIFEDFDGEYTSGYTGGYIKVYVAGRMEGSARVALRSLFRDGALAEVKDD